MNLRSGGRWTTAYIKLPESYNVEDIDVSTIMLNDAVPAENSKVCGRKLMVRFDRSEIIAHIYHVSGITYGDVTLTITGQLTDGTMFEGSDTIKIKFGGDADSSGQVDLTDFYLWRENFGKTPDQCPPDVHPDFDDNKHVELDDFYVWRDNFGATVPP